MVICTIKSFFSSSNKTIPQGVIFKNIMNNHLSLGLVGCKFSCMPRIPYGTMFHRVSMINNCHKSNVFTLLISIVRHAFFPIIKNLEYSNNPDSKILFYISGSDRKSCEINFNKVVSTIDAGDTLIERHCKGRFSLKGFFIFFVLNPIWFFQMFGCQLSFMEKLQVIRDLEESYLVFKFIKKNIKIGQYNLLVCFYDSLLHESMLSLLFKKEGKTTATLQHGQFNAWRENTEVNCGLEITSSHSDYILCWNKFVQEEAVKCGRRIDELPVLGIIGNIGIENILWEKPNNNIFGVVISHPSWEFENVEMIKAANILSNITGMKYYLKLHPNYQEHYFDNIVNKKYYVGNIDKGIDIIKYVNMVDFSIVGSSSVFVEMVYTKHDVLRYSSQKPSDKYKDVCLGSVFYKAEEVIECYEKLNIKDKDELFDFLCETDKVKQKYREFFMRFCS